MGGGKLTGLEGEGQTYFPELSRNQVKVAIGRAFDDAGANRSGIHLRHHYESTLEHVGFRQVEDIGPTMGHAKGNKITARYAHAAMEKLAAMASVFDGHNPVTLARTLQKREGTFSENP